MISDDPHIKEVTEFNETPLSKVENLCVLFISRWQHGASKC